MKKAKLAGAILILAALLARPEAAVSGAQRAMRLWCGGVAPALFPFLALLPALTGPEACAAYNAIFSRLMRPLFGLPGAAAPALIAGLIAGSPGGAIAVRRVAAESGMSAGDARRMGLALCGFSPAYLISGVGVGLYGSAALGAKLALIQMCVQLLLLALLRGSVEGGEKVAPLPDAARAQNPVRAAVESALGICGYMVFFSAVACAAASFFGEIAGAALLLAIDLPSGLAGLAQWEAPGRMLVQGMAIGFGGLCLAAQNLDALRPLGAKWGEYLGVRGIAASIFACSSGLLLRPIAPQMEIYAGNVRRAYAFSLLAAALCALPGLILLSKSLFLNKANPRDFKG